MGTPDQEQHIGPKFRAIRHSSKNPDGTAYYTVDVSWDPPKDKKRLWYPVVADTFPDHHEAFNEAQQTLSITGQEEFRRTRQPFAVPEIEDDNPGQLLPDSLRVTPRHRNPLERLFGRIIERRFTVTYRYASGAWHEKTFRAPTSSQALKKAEKQLA